MKIKVRVVNGEIVFGSPLSKRIFLEKNNNKDALIEIDDVPTAQMRRYFEGALIPAIFYQHPRADWADFRECREAIKLEFLPSYVKDLRKNKVKVAKSTTDLSKERFSTFIEMVTQWMEENGLTVPDAEDYKNWINSAPVAGEVYKPLQRLKESYTKAKESLEPPWRKKHV